MTIKIGDRISNFTAKDSNGNDFDLQNYLGKKTLIIYFYPKDDTPGCTKQACEFRNQYDKFLDLDAVVIGISGDDSSSHQNFSAKYQLPFILLSDSDKKIRRKFGIKSTFFGLLSNRVTFVIDKKGIVIMRYDNIFKPIEHIKKSLETLINEQ